MIIFSLSILLRDFFLVINGESMSIVKDRIVELAKAKKISLPKLEEALGFGNGTIVKWDNASPRLDGLSAVADYFDVSLDYLAGRTDNPKGIIVAHQLIESIESGFNNEAYHISEIKRDLIELIYHIPDEYARALLSITEQYAKDSL